MFTALVAKDHSFALFLLREIEKRIALFVRAVPVDMGRPSRGLHSERHQGDHHKAEAIWSSILPDSSRPM
jgi:hypothetical protein